MLITDNCTFDDLYQLARDWAKERRILDTCSVFSQFSKLVEEVKEIASDPLDGIGDSLVALTVLSAMLGKNLEHYIPIYDGKTALQALGDLADCLNKGNFPAEAIASVYGLLHRKANMYNLDIHDCFIHSINEIYKRKGQLRNGQWVKLHDIKEPTNV